jgi:palmitoyl-protein thioesterase
LADINNERPVKNKTYAENLSSLQKFVMIRFTEEKTVVPADSSVISFQIVLMKWFGDYNATSGKHTPLYKRDIYTEDWIGLKVLDDKDGLVFLESEGPHVSPFSSMTDIRCE